MPIDLLTISNSIDRNCFRSVHSLTSLSTSEDMEPPPYEPPCSVEKFSLSSNALPRRSTLSIVVDGALNDAISCNSLISGHVSLVPLVEQYVSLVKIKFMRSVMVQNDLTPSGINQTYATLTTRYIAVDMAVTPGYLYKIQFSFRAPSSEEMRERNIEAMPSIGNNMIVFSNSEEILIRHYLVASVIGSTDFPADQCSRVLKFNPSPPLPEDDESKSGHQTVVISRPLYVPGASIFSKKKLVGEMEVSAKPISHQWDLESGTVDVTMKVRGLDAKIDESAIGQCDISCTFLRRVELFKGDAQERSRMILLRYTHQTVACKWRQSPDVLNEQYFVTSVPYKAPKQVPIPFKDHNISCSYTMKVSVRLGKSAVNLMLPVILHESLPTMNSNPPPPTYERSQSSQSSRNSRNSQN